MMKAIFLDRDGTINVDTGYTHRISDIVFEKNALEGLKILQEDNFALFIVTNQSGIGKGYYTETDFHRVNNFIINELKKSDIEIIKTYFCPYHPESEIEKYKLTSPLRKPGTGMLRHADSEYSIDKKNSWMIGDKWADTKAGKNFGIKSILLKSGKAGSDVQHKTNVEYIAQDLLDAANFIINFKNHE